jgi:methylated-DNA-protein-cysteine methyltransferase-like protein
MPHGAPSPLAEAVARVVAGIASGQVATYGEVALEAGAPGAARAVGRILARSKGLPWWRVVTASGRLVPGLEAEHAARLVAEGVNLREQRVVVAAWTRQRGSLRPGR